MLTGEIATGDVEGDWVARLVERMPKVFRVASRRNLWPGEEQPVGGDVAADAWFLEFVTKRDLVHGDGALAECDFQLLRRFASGDRARAAAAKTEAWAAHDELRLMGTDPFVGAVTRGRWTETRILAAPVLLGDRHLSLNFTAWRTS